MALPDINDRLNGEQFNKVYLSNYGGELIIELDPINRPVPIPFSVAYPVQFYSISEDTFIETYILTYRRKDINGELLTMQFNLLSEDSINTLQEITKYGLCYLSIGYGSSNVKSYRAAIRNVNWNSIGTLNKYNVSMSFIILEQI